MICLHNIFFIKILLYYYINLYNLYKKYYNHNKSHHKIALFIFFCYFIINYYIFIILIINMEIPLSIIFKIFKLEFIFINSLLFKSKY